LSFELPSSIADAQLQVIPAQYGGDGTAKFANANFFVPGGIGFHLYNTKYV